MKIGFIGMGIMGKPMALNLVKAGYDVTVSNRNMAKCEPLVAAGAKSGSYIEVAESCDVVITMLPNGPQVKSVMLGENGVAAHMKAGSTFIDMSSINPVDSKALCEGVAPYGVEMLDAPVSGGEPKAIDGTLSIMVGGKQDVFDKYKEMLSAMGSSVVRCGDVGAGNTTKLANQIIVACNIQALAEALTLAQKAGIAGNDKPGFKIDLHIKDLNNALDCAHSVGAPVPMTASVQEILQWMHNHDGGNKDHSAIAQYYEYLSGIQIGR